MTFSGKTFNCCLGFFLLSISPHVFRAQSNGRSTDNVRPDRGLDRSNSRLAVHFWMRTFIIFSIWLSLNAFCSITL